MGNQTSSKCRVILRYFPYNGVLFGLVICKCYKKKCLGSGGVNALKSSHLKCIGLQGGPENQFYMEVVTPMGRVITPVTHLIFGRLSGWFNSVCNWIRGRPGRDLKTEYIRIQWVQKVALMFQSRHERFKTIPVKLMEQNDDSWIGN